MTDPQRSLEMIVDAPLQDCIHALGRLVNSGGKYTRETVNLQVNQLSVDYAEFTLTLKRVNGRSLITTALQGSLHLNPKHESTTVIGKIPPIYGRILLSLMVICVIAFFVAISSLPMLIKAVGTLTLVIAIAPFYLLHVYQQDRDDVERVLTMTVRELNGAAYRDRQQAIQASQDESPFY